MGYDDISPRPHKEYCDFLEGEGTRKQAVMPRGFVKTWIGSIAYPIWVTIPREPDEFPPTADPSDKFWQLGSDLRILIASYIISNAEKMLQLVRYTYEKNTAMQMLFPEVIPINFRKTRWSNKSACINRESDATESTFEAAGIGGGSISRHYDLVIEDDLIYAKKDDLTGQELQPDEDDINKAIGWHKMVTSLLVPGMHTRIYNYGTRWAKKDLVDYIRINEPSYKKFERAAVDTQQLNQGKHWRECEPEWKSMYPHKKLEEIYQAQGPYMFATQYLLKPMAPEEMIFDKSWLQFYQGVGQVPDSARKFTTVDLSSWGTQGRKKESRAVVLTAAWDSKNHMWILHYNVGKMNPSQVLTAVVQHHKMFKPEVIGIEAVYYQKAMVHFARKEMEYGHAPWLPIRQLMPESNQSKEVRIRALEPLASNLALHCKDTHHDFIEEFSEYVPGNVGCKADILDAAAYQLQLARPAPPVHTKNKPPRDQFQPVGNMDGFLQWAWKGEGSKDRFGNQQVTYNAYADQEVEEELVTDVEDVSWEDMLGF